MRMKEEEVKELWTGLYEASAQCCMHGANCAQGMECQVCIQAALEHLSWKYLGQNFGPEQLVQDQVSAFSTAPAWLLTLLLLRIIC